MDPLSDLKGALTFASAVRGIVMLLENVDLTFDQIQDLKSSLHASNLKDEVKNLLVGLIDFNSWLPQQLLENVLPASNTACRKNIIVLWMA